jgi:hypothetical protein
LRPTRLPIPPLGQQFDILKEHHQIKATFSIAAAKIEFLLLLMKKAIEKFRPTELIVVLSRPKNESKNVYTYGIKREYILR